MTIHPVNCMTLYIECIHSLLMFMRYFYAHDTLDVSAIYSMGMCLNGNRVDFNNMPIEGSRFLPFWQDDCFHFVSGSIPRGENWEFGSQIENSDMGGASYRLGIRACAGGSLWIAHRATLYVSCREKRRSMASAPDESGATAELQQLKVHDEDYNPFTEEGN